MKPIPAGLGERFPIQKEPKARVPVPDDGTPFKTYSPEPGEMLTFDTLPGEIRIDDDGISIVTYLTTEYIQSTERSKP